jgi:hypothetical protein
MQIIRLEAQNIKRLSAVTIEPNADASAVVLGGGNEEGKIILLDAIEMALAGDRVSPPEPIRRGRTKAKVVVDLGDMIVTRRFTDKGSSLVIENREGLRYKSPQTLLDGFYNNLTFDPLAFAESKEQPTILRRLVGLDTSDLDDARKKVLRSAHARQPRRRQGKGRAREGRALSRHHRAEGRGRAPGATRRGRPGRAHTGRC